MLDASVWDSINKLLDKMSVTKEEHIFKHPLFHLWVARADKDEYILKVYQAEISYSVRELKGSVAYSKLVGQYHCRSKEQTMSGIQKFANMLEIVL